MDQSTQEYALGVIRHVLTTAAGGLVASGYLTNSDAQTIIGGVIAALGVAWSMWQKKQAAQKLAAAKVGK